MNAVHDFAWRFLRLYAIYVGIAVVAALGLFLVYELIVLGGYLAETFSLEYIVFSFILVIGMLGVFASFGRAKGPMVLYGVIGVAVACFAIVLVGEALFSVGGMATDAALGITTVTTLVGVVVSPPVMNLIHKVAALMSGAILDLFESHEKDR
jgi:hypothetical protein